jgi:hypothetical protein
LDGDIEIFQQPHAAPAGARAVVAGQRDEVQLVEDGKRSGEIGDEDDARLQRRDEDRFPPFVVVGDLRTELLDARFDLLGGEVDLPDAIGDYEARSSLYRSARRAMSRL